MKKITINNSESSFEPIKDNIEILRKRFDILFEGIDTFCVESGLIKNVIEFYFFDSDTQTNDVLKKMFASISDDVGTKIENL